MSQAIFPNINPSTTSGNQLATLLNGFKDAVASGFSGTSRPSNLQSGGYWIDTTNNPTTWDYKIYNGTIDITVFTLDLASGTASITSATNLFEISKISNDAVGPIIRLIKARISGGGQTLVDDSVGLLQFQGTRDDSIEATQASIEVLSKDNVTSSAQGAALIFKVTTAGGSSLSEIMRLYDAKVGIGIAIAQETLHVKGTGIKSHKASDDAVGSKLVMRKARVASLGQVLSSDVISNISSTSTDDSGTEIEVSRTEVVATENHSSTAQGVTWSLKTKATGSTTLTERIGILGTGQVSIPSLTVTNLYASTFESGTVVETADAKVILNKGGTQAGANSGPAGFEIEMSDATDAAIGYDSSLASKFKMGEVGNLKEIVDVSSTQTLSAKTLTSPVVNSPSIVTPSRSDVKQGTESALTTYASTAANGQWAFATDTKVMYQVIDGALVPSGSGGGGGSLVWNKTGSPSPVTEEVDGFYFESFDQESSQEIYTVITVPSSYRAGKPIKLKAGKFFANIAAGKVFFKTQSTLIGSTSVLGTYTNQRTSTNTVVTVNATPNTINDIGDLDLTSSIGEINSVAVAAGDKLRVRLYRDNSAEAGGAGPALIDARLLITSFEVTFS